MFELPQAKMQTKTQIVNKDPGSEKLALLQQELQQEVIRLKELNNVLNLKLAALRSQNVNTGDHNANSSALIDSAKYNHLSPKQRKSMSLKSHKLGLALYKQKSYTEALVELKKAVAYYEHYLYLFPSSDKSDEIKIQIERIKSDV